MKTESKAVLLGLTPDFGKCEAKFTPKFNGLETNAGLGVCPTEGDEASINARITGDANDLAILLAGGVLGDCPTDLATCNADLGTCSGDLTTCDSDVTTCNGGLTSCNSGFATCTSDLSSCTGDLSTAQNDLTTCNGSLGTCSGNLTTCSSSLSTCSGSLATCNAGTATAGDVLAGETFSSSAGLGVIGTMTNVGQQNVTPGNAAVTITQGYHDGTGAVAGDADLVAGNITAGVDIFGVVGTASSGGLPKTGQTICYNAAGTVIACAGTGQDGELQEGIARSFTDNGDGTITDNATGLMWEKLSDDGGIHDADNAYTWTNAFATKVATLNSGSFAGYTNWRVPNQFELYSLVNLGAVGPATYSAFNNGCVAACTVLTCSCTPSTDHWSSSTYQNVPSVAWFVGFFTGDTATNNKTNTLRVRAVRAGS